MFRANNFDKLLDKATSNLRLDPDWPTILQICDLIRQNDCTPKYAVAGLKKKLYSQNPHQAMFALLTLESIVKNCGSGIHDEVASKAFCEMLRDLVKTTQHENLRNKILELIQAWAFAFRNNPKYRAVQGLLNWDTVNILKAECYKFPTLKESDAMFSADTAPEWADGEVCHRCRVAFSLMVRRHHCRACGQVFCQQCSSKTSTLPKFGIEKEVRVCDACYDKVSRPPTSTAKLDIVDTSNDYGPTQPQKRPPGTKTAEELQEEEELQLALALSQSEAEQKEKAARSRSHINPPTSLHPTVSPTPSSVSASPEHGAATNPELSRYLDRGYWEQRLARDTASAPAAPPSLASSEPSQFPEQEYAKPASGKTSEDDAEDKEIEEFCSSLKSQVEIFVNRMKSNSSRGRSIANDTSVQTLFMNITAMHSTLLRYIQLQDDKRVYLESLQDKITQIRDSRAALDTLRAEHAARLAAAAEAAERQRQMQMAAKLQAMRKKKHEYLQYQRQVALQRVQEQEREMQMRQEQQKHQYMMSSAGGYYMPGVSMPQYQAGYTNQPIYANPQQYHQMMPQVTTDGTLGLPGQTQMSQPMSANPMATAAQSMSTMSQGFPLSTPSAISQATMNPQQNMPNIRQPLSQQLPMIMQQMHQMRLPSQTAQLGQNGYATQNMPQQNGQTKQLGQPMPPISVAQQNLGQQPMLATNPMLSMQMQNMRMPINQHPSMYSNSQLGQLPSQIMSQPMSLPSQQMLQSQGMTSQGPMQGFLPPSSQSLQGPQLPQSQGQLPQQVPQQQLTQGHPMSLPNQPMPPQSVQMSMPMMQGQTIHSQSQMMQQPQPSQLPPQGQQMPSQSQQMPPVSQQIPSQGQHIPHQGQQMPPQGQQMIPQGQQMPPQGQQIPPQGQQMPSQGQQMPPQGQQMPSHGQQITSQHQQIPSQGQQMAPQHHQMPPQGQHMPPQGQQMPQSQQVPPQSQQMPPLSLQGSQGPQYQPSQMPQAPNQGPPVQGQPMPMQHMSQGQQISQGPPMSQNGPGQPVKMPQNFNPQQPPSQTGPTNVKSEHNNNTAELISFD